MRNKKKILRYIIPFFVVFSFVFIPFLCLATNIEVDIPDPIKPSTLTDKGIYNMANKIVEAIYKLLFISSVGFFLFSLYGYFTAGGDATKIKRVNKQLLLAAAVMALGLIAYSIAGIIEKFLTTP